jgi:signal transduction histidine kinase
MVLYDHNMRIVHLNAEFARLARLDPEEARGKILYDLAPATLTRRHIHQSVLSGESIDERSVPHKFPDEERPRCSDIQYRPIRDPQGNIVGILSALIDVTEVVYARQELQELLGHKDHFLDLSAHELRTPITVIKAFAQLAQRPEFRDNLSWLEHAFEVIGRHAGHLARLVDDMIEVSRIGRGSLPLYMERFDLRELVAALQVDYAPVFDRCSSTIELPDKPVMLEADRNRIGAVLANVIENADRFAGDKAPCSIRISVERRDLNLREKEGAERMRAEEALVSIHDNGIGIPPDEQHKVFDRFYRASNAGTRARNGLGLGLYICKNIVEQHGGTIWLESIQGRGTTCRFTLPLPAAE